MTGEVFLVKHVNPEHIFTMRIIKCDICKKRIKPDAEIIRLEIVNPGFNHFEICSDCGKPIMKILNSKKLIRHKKLKAG